MAASPSPPLTILTPTYNRAHLLPRLYHSLKREWPGETGADWLIVDDGSTDGTARAVEAMAAEGIVPITHLRVPHGGKHRALNAGFARARGDWIAIVDSDDWFLPGGLARVRAEVRRAQELGAAGVLLPLNVPKAARQYRFRRPDRALSFIARMNEEPGFDSTLIFQKPAKDRRSPVFEGETFLAEAALMYQAWGAREIYISNAAAVCAEYQPDGLSAQMRRNRIRAPRGAMHVYQTMLAHPLPNPLRLRALANFGRFWWHALLRGKRPLGPRSLSQALVLPLTWVFTLYDAYLLRRPR